jgi:tryptophanyl-tRNA synthetase
MKKRLFSGVKPSGHLHIGNWLGSIKQWAALQDEYECIFSVVDLHAMTDDYDVGGFADLCCEVTGLFIACGVDPDKSAIFIQSHIPEHSELCWIFDTLTPVGLLSRMTQYKDRVVEKKENVNVGLFNYPVLQAADVLLYKGEVVPVGEDQCQHLELCRDIARKFNNRFGKTFPEPKTILNETPRIMGLDGERKMSKSYDNCLYLLDEPAVVEKKMLTAKTDPQRLRRSDPGRPEVCNIFTLHKAFSSENEIAQVDSGCRNAAIGCVDCKKMLVGNLNEALSPIRRRYAELRADRDTIPRILKEGAEKVRPIARETMAEVRRKAGLAM